MASTAAALAADISHPTRRWSATSSKAVGCALAVCLSCGPVPAGAEDASAGLRDYTRRVWSMTEGLPQNTVTAVRQTREGYLWVATLDGIARFDGVRFETFNLIRAAGMENNIATALAEAPDGSVWVGTRSGLARFHDGRFSVMTTSDGLSDATIRAIHVDRRGVTWIGTRWGGLNRLQDGRITTWTVKDGLLHADVRALAEDPSGALWIGTAAGLNRLRNGVLERVVPPGTPLDALVASLWVDRDGTAWVGTPDALWALQPVAGTDTFLVPASPVLRGTEVRALLQDARGDVWAGLGDGLARIRDGHVERTAGDGLSYHNVRALAADVEGSLWIGTDGGGLNRWRSASVVMSPERDLQRPLAVLYTDRDGVMWAGGNCGGLTRWDRGEVTTFTRADGLPDDCVWSLAGQSDGTLWVGTGHGLARLQRGRFTRYTTAEGLSSNRIMSIAVAPDGALWLGTGGAGADRMSGGRITNYSTRNGLGHDDVRALVAGRDGSVWIGTLGGGVARWRNGRIERLTRAEGLSNNNVLALLEDADGTVWIATNGGGLNRYRAGTFAHFTREQGLPTDGVFHIVDDGQGFLWMSGNRGVFRVARRDLEAVAAGRRARVDADLFDAAQGLRPGGAMGGMQPAGALDAQGRLWFPTIEGAAIVDGRRIVRNPVAPPVLVERVVVDRRPMDAASLSRVPAGSRDVAIHYTALSFVAPGEVRFKYRLEGFEQEWIDAESRRTAYYTNLPPGDYTFRVSAANEDGVWNPAGTSISFRILPHFYETRAFLAACVAAAGGLLWAGLQLRDRQTRARQRELTQQVEQALAEIKVLSGLLPICASCKRIRDEGDEWKGLERYIHEHSQAAFTHGICPECMERLYPEDEAVSTA